MLFPSRRRLSIYVIHATAELPVPRDSLACTPNLGFTTSFASIPYRSAFAKIPPSAQLSHFTPNLPSPATANNYVQVPEIYYDSESHPSFMITIELDGHSQTNTSVSVSYDKVKSMARTLYAECLPHHEGGVRTYGLGDTLQALLEPTAYSDGSPIELGPLIALLL